MTRREWLASAAATGLLKAAPLAPTAPLSIAKCSSYDADLPALLSTMFDQLGGLGRIVRNKTITIKLNPTGSPNYRVQGKPIGVTHYMHPKPVFAMAQLLNRAGARRIRFIENAWASGGLLEEHMLDAGWNERPLLNSAPNPVTTDALSTAMGYDPRAQRGTKPFATCDNTMLLAEGHGIGNTDLSRIEVRGESIADARFRFEA